MGAGWLRPEYDAAGMPFDPAGVRISRMEEGLRVMKGLWSDGEFSFSGQHYSITDLNGMPKPVQKPWPPLLIGGGGKRMLSIAAREADIVGFNPQTRPDGTLDWTTTSVDAVSERVGWVREAAGIRFDDLELNLTVTIASTTDLDAGAMEIAERWSVSPEHVRNSPFALLGEPERMVETLLERRDHLGITYITVGERGMESLAQKPSSSLKASPTQQSAFSAPSQAC